MVNNIISAIFLTALFFIGISVIADIAVVGIKTFEMMEDSITAEEVLGKIETLENDSFSFRFHEGHFLVKTKPIFVEYCGFFELIDGYQLCYISNFSKCVDIYPKIYFERLDNFSLLSVEIKDISFDLINMPGNHKLRIEKFKMEKSSFIIPEIRNSTQDQGLNISAFISESVVYCQKDVSIEVVYGNHDESRIVSILKAEEYTNLKAWDLETLKSKSIWYNYLLGSGNAEFRVSTDLWSPGTYKVIFANQSYINDEITLMLTGNVTLDYGFVKQNYEKVGKLIFLVDRVVIYDEVWAP